MIELNKLLPAFNQGDAEAFQKLFDALYPRVFNYVNRLIIDREASQDITADLFVKVWQKQGYFETFEKLKAFVFVAARHECYDFIKDKNNLLQRQKDFLYVYTQHNSHTVTLPSFAERERAEIKGDVYEYLLSEIDRLPNQCRKVFQMAFFDGKKNGEIAESLDISEKTVRNQKVLAIKILRSAIRNQYLLAAFVQLFIF